MNAWKIKSVIKKKSYYSYLIFPKFCLPFAKIRKKEAQHQNSDSILDYGEKDWKNSHVASMFKVLKMIIKK